MVVWHVASVQDTHSTETDHAGSERELDLLDERRKNGQKNTDSLREENKNLQFKSIRP